MLSAATKPLRFDSQMQRSDERARVRILCATDLSSRSEPAMLRALALAQSLDGEVLLLHIVDDEAPIRLVGRTAGHALDALKWHARRLARFRVRPELSVRIGDPKQMIAAVAQHWGADLIVIGRHRRRRAQQLRSSTAEHIAKRGRRPVLVVNTNSTEDYSGVVLVGGRPASLVRLANRFELFEAARVSIRPVASLLDRLILSVAGFARALGMRSAGRARQLVRRRIEKPGIGSSLDSLGFEPLRYEQTAGSLVDCMKDLRGPQLLAVKLGRFGWIDRSYGRCAAKLALRERACDVLLVSTTQ